MNNEYKTCKYCFYYHAIYVRICNSKGKINYCTFNTEFVQLANTGKAFKCKQYSPTKNIEEVE